MTDPLTYLAAALDAAQRDAEAATPGPWEAHPPLDSGDAWEIRAVVTPGREWRWVVGAEGGGGVYDAPDARHIAGNHPQATLRRIAADRKMLALHGTPHTVVDGFCVEEGGECTHKGEAECPICGQEPCDTVLLIAEGWGWTEETT